MNFQVTGKITHRRVVGHIAFCKLEEYEDVQFIFKKDFLNPNSAQPFPKSKSKLPLGLKIQADVNEIQGENLINNWEIIEIIQETKSIEKNQKSNKLCRKWSLNKPCNANTCKFRHYFSSEKEIESTKRIIDSREKFKLRDAKINEEYHLEDPFKDKKFKAVRAKIFVDWIIEKFGISYLQSGSGVIDIAGGAGKVASELNRNNIKCTVIDPFVRKKQKELDKKGELSYFQIQDYFSVDWMNKSSENFNLITNCSLLIGLHADQPTVDIVRVALLNHKPFAVVPCCVFTNLFPERRLQDKSEIKTTNQLCKYITELDESISTDFLNFKGRNKVCFLQIK